MQSAKLVVENTIFGNVADTITVHWEPEPGSRTEYEQGKDYTTLDLHHLVSRHINMYCAHNRFSSVFEDDDMFSDLQEQAGPTRTRPHVRTL